MDGQTQKAEDNRRNQRRFYIVPVVIISVTAIIFISMYMATVRRVQYIYTNQTYQNAAALKRATVSETVENLVTEIEQMRTLRLFDETGLIRGLLPAVRTELETAGKNENVARIRALFADNDSLSNLTCVVYRQRDREILLDERGFAGETAVWSDELADAFAVREQVEADGLTAVYGITETAFDQEMLSVFADRLETFSSEEGTKFWIDRLRVLDNGQTVTVRVLDPEDPGRVGMSSSGGGLGNGPDRYATEGLLEAGMDGQVFHNVNASWADAAGGTVTTQTVTCAEYYAPYEWAICGAFRLDTIAVDAMDSQEVSRKETLRLGARLAIGFAAVLAAAIFLILKNNASYFHLRQKKLRDQVERDALTGANTRGYGQQLLEEAFQRFNGGGEPSPVLMVLDVDKFKSINDTYGHDGGDEALKRVVKAAAKVGRGRDCVIRWGGDEFVAVFYRLERARCEAMANKLRKAIADTQVKHGGQSFQVTVSIGVTWFQFGDYDYAEALKRADGALYESKEQGRNRVCVAKA